MTEQQQRGALDGVGIVYFGNDWFAENRTSSHHIARRLAQKHPLLYVDSPGMRVPTLSGRDASRLWRKLKGAFQPPRQVQPGLWHCTVPQIPFHKVPGIAWLNRVFGLWAVRRAIRRVGFERYLSWFLVPHPGFMARRIGEQLCVYYCIDDYAAHPGVDADRISRSDAELTARADQLFVAPPSLLALKQRQNPTAQFSPHGVDAELFRQASDPGTVIPPGARGLGHPVIGFFGLLAEWVDLELIGWLAAQRPQWSFLLVGQEKTDTRVLRGLPNVRLVGPQPYESLPGWARAFDVAIIPYVLNQQVRNANPLKLREYLATGRPVVAVRNAEIERFAQWVRIADGREQFLAAIEAALLPEAPEAALQRFAAVAPHTWDARVSEVLAVVAERYRSQGSA